VTEHGYVYIEMRPDHAGRAKHTIFVADLAAVVAQIAGRGLDPVERHTYDNGVQKATYRDPTATRFGFGVAPTMTRLETPS
jgi:hypothetical protein